jgi:hypothetical protein
LTEESRYADQIEQPRGGGVEVSGQLGDLITEAFELGRGPDDRSDDRREANARVGVHR